MYADDVHANLCLKAPPPQEWSASSTPFRGSGYQAPGKRGKPSAAPCFIGSKRVPDMRIQCSVAGAASTKRCNGGLSPRRETSNAPNSGFETDLVLRDFMAYGNIRSFSKCARDPFPRPERGMPLHITAQGGATRYRLSLCGHSWPLASFFQRHHVRLVTASPCISWSVVIGSNRDKRLLQSANEQCKGQCSVESSNAAGFARSAEVEASPSAAAAARSVPGRFKRPCRLYAGGHSRRSPVARGVCVDGPRFNVSPCFGR